MKGKLIVAAILMAIVVAAGFAAYYFSRQPAGPCMPLGGARVLRSRVSSSAFGALTEYSLPSPGRWSNGIAAAADGSVWFGEESVPGVAHLFANGTLVEYPWPSASHPTSKDCGYETGIWGVAVWNGMVWGTDSDENALVGINPQSGAARVINVSSGAASPYTLSLDPDGSLWFTSLLNAAVLGRVSQNYSVSFLHVNGVGEEYPAQLDFVNSSLAYMVTINTLNDSGGIYSFDPAGASTSITPQRVGADFELQAPDSIAVGGGTVWVAEHGPSTVAAYDLGSGHWSLIPTTQQGNITTLPYFVAYGDGGVWFNEHYANRIAFVGSGAETMTEYSESNPPITNASEIGNDLTIAQAPGGLWFTSTTGNYIGFANSSYVPSFSISPVGANSGTALPGGRSELNFTVTGSWRSGLSVIVSDSESYTDAPSLISMAPSPSSLPAGSGPQQLRLNVELSSRLASGDYTLAVTVSDGLILRTAFYYLEVP